MSEQEFTFEKIAAARADWTEEDWARHEAEIDRRRAEEERERAEQIQKWRRQDLIERGMPAKDLERVLAGRMDDTQALTVAGEFYANTEQVLLVLSGERGCGKTTAAAWWLTQEHPVRIEYVRRRNATFVDANRLSRWPRYDEDRMFDLERASALVVDDLGVEYDDDKGNFRSMFDALINARYAACLPTVITTNLPAAAFKARYGERVADRIREVGRFAELAAKSMRGRR